MDGGLKKTFYGSQTDNVCAFCWKHKLYLTTRQMRNRECLKRGCDALQRLDHPFWVTRDNSKKARMERKARLEAQYEELML